MSSRFTYFWKQLVPSNLGSSDFNAPFEKASYLSMFSPDPLIERPFFAEKQSNNALCHRKRRQVCQFEDVAG